MKDIEKKTDQTDMGVLSIPNVMLEAAGIPQDSDLTVETLPGVLLIGTAEPLRAANKPLLDLFTSIGIEPEEVAEALEKGGFFQMSQPMYKLVDGKGRVLIPKNLRDAAGMEYGSIVRLGLADGKVTVCKVDIVEVGDQSPAAVEAYVRAAFKSMPDSTRLELIGELSGLLRKKEG